MSVIQVLKQSKQLFVSGLLNFMGAQRMILRTKTNNKILNSGAVKNQNVSNAI